MPLHCTGMGLALLAFAPVEVQEEVLSLPLHDEPDQNLIPPAVMRRTLAEVRHERLAIYRRLDPDPLVAVAAPIFGEHEEAVAALGVLLPERIGPAEAASATPCARPRRASPGSSARRAAWTRGTPRARPRRGAGQESPAPPGRDRAWPRLAAVTAGQRRSVCGDQVERLADRADRGGQVEEPVQHRGDHGLPYVDPGGGERRRERLAGGAQVVVLGVEHQGRAQPAQVGQRRERVAVGLADRAAQVVEIEEARRLRRERAAGPAPRASARRARLAPAAGPGGPRRRRRSGARAAARRRPGA